MSDIIHLLPDAVANQIAAGEVIQRPSSVIKELMENAIDAGATLVQVVVQEAGKTMIQVADNGCGMSGTDARLAFERHATSKITSADDLFALRTMGFRGEALPSIVAVSQVVLKTRRKEDELGTQLVIEGSKVVEQREVNCPVGANFVVNNLFYNVPARRKFLKSNTTELNAVITEFERIALAHPDIAFKLYSSDALIFDLTAGSERQRIAGIFGKRLDSQLLPVEVQTSLVNLKGFVGNPESSKKKGAHQFFFVNGRYMRHPYFAKAVVTAFERIIPEGDQIPFFLFMDVDPARIDVNIHPTKTEIKFQDEQAIWQIVLAAVRETLGKHSAIPTIDFDTENKPDIPCFNPNVSYAPPTVDFDPTYNPFEVEEKTEKPAYPQKTSAYVGPAAFKALYGNPERKDETEIYLEARPQDEQPALYDATAESEQRIWTQQDMQMFQYAETYVVLPVKSGLMFVHQYRAHVRVLYNQYLVKLRENGLSSQGLLFPEMVELSPRQAIVLQEHLSMIERAGFDITSLGGNSFSVNAIPAGVDGARIQELVVGVTDSLLDGTDTESVRTNDAVCHALALALARQSAIRSNTPLKKEQMAELIRQLFTGEMPGHTPDGRLIAATIAEENIEALFD